MRRNDLLSPQAGDQYPWRISKILRRRILWAEQGLGVILVKASNAAFLNMNDCKLFDILHEIIHFKMVRLRYLHANSLARLGILHMLWLARSTSTKPFQLRSRWLSLSRLSELSNSFNQAFISHSAGSVSISGSSAVSSQHSTCKHLSASDKFINFLKQQRLPGTSICVPEMMPGDVLDALSSSITACGEERFVEEDALTVHHRIRGFV